MLLVNAGALVKRQAMPETGDADDGVRGQRSHVRVHPAPLAFLTAGLTALRGRAKDAAT